MARGAVETDHMGVERAIIRLILGWAPLALEAPRGALDLDYAAPS